MHASDTFECDNVNTVWKVIMITKRQRSQQKQERRQTQTDDKKSLTNMGISMKIKRLFIRIQSSLSVSVLEFFVFFIHFLCARAVAGICSRTFCALQSNGTLAVFFFGADWQTEVGKTKAFHFIYADFVCLLRAIAGNNNTMRLTRSAFIFR